MANVGLLGCREDARPAPATSTTATASAAPRASKLTGIVVALDGTPLPLENALAFSRGGAAVHITFSTHPLECDKLGGSGFELEPGEILFDVTVAPAPMPDGTTHSTITGARMGKVSRQGSLGHAEIADADPRKDVKATFKMVELGFPPNKLFLDGTVTAQGCGILPWSEKAEVRPQRELVVELNGRRIGMNGASLSTEKDGRRTLRITSEPHACGHGIQGADIGLTLTLPPDATTPVELRLSGYAIPRQLTADQGIEVSLDSAGDGPRAVALTGTSKLGNHTLTIDGVASAIICP